MDGYYFYNASAGRYAVETAAQAKSRAGRVEDRVRELEMRLDRVSLACEALWTIVREKLDLSDEDLKARIDAIDLSDGQLDGRVKRDIKKCPSCGRAVNRKHNQCMYCRAPVDRDVFE